MSAESDLFAALNVPSVTGIATGGIHPDSIPEGKAFPAVAYARGGTEPITSIASIHFGDFVSFTVMCWAAPGKRDAADALATAVEAALRTAGHTVTGRDAGMDPETGFVSSSVQVTLLSV